ncbi:MAG TPA: hypothetical protein ENK02_08915 [Planctomycetes bacterium]|nr:hypothetical protein [Planctomycetota bacterium]
MSTPKLQRWIFYCGATPLVLVSLTFVLWAFNPTTLWARVFGLALLLEILLVVCGFVLYGIMVLHRIRKKRKGGREGSPSGMGLDETPSPKGLARGTWLVPLNLPFFFVVLVAAYFVQGLCWVTFENHSGKVLKNLRMIVTSKETRYGDLLPGQVAYAFEWPSGDDCVTFFYTPEGDKEKRIAFGYVASDTGGRWKVRVEPDGKVLGQDLLHPGSKVFPIPVFSR